MQVVDCKALRNEILDDVKAQVSAIEDVVTLAILQVEGDDASNVYIRNKIKTCAEVGICCIHVKLPNDISQNKLEKQIIDLNEDDSVHGIMLQLPIPKHLDANKAINLIKPDCDVDGLTDVQIGRLASNSDDAIVPATAYGCYKILASILGDDLSGLRVGIVNRSKLIGIPLASLLRNHNATVTVCHSKTNHNVLRHTMIFSDIVIMGTGQIRQYNKYNFADDAQIVIDCSICRDKNNRLCGELKTESFMNNGDDFYLAKSPGGVGLLTTACLMLNTVKAYKLQKSVVK